ncbi:MAG: chromosome partitioning protein ParB [Gordonia polyisoprenivorans]|nr:chromosome partitioning protein ParB [Gordonia polyisoprenivorans]
MLSGLTAAEAAVDGARVVEVAANALIPHPFNDPTRSTVRPGVGKWDELLESVAANGVRVPALAVTRDAFDNRWPGLIPADTAGTHVLIYGHRRRAAALATNTVTLPVTVDDAVLDAPDGGMLAMYEENAGREDLTPIAEAEILAKFLDDVHVSQRELSSLLGVAQPTISRRLSLLLLDPELQSAVAAGSLSATEAAIIGTRLPYGPLRSWQKTRDAEQDTNTRRTEQRRAHALTTAGALAAHATDRVLAERASRTRAAEMGVDLIDPVATFGSVEQARAHRIYDDVVDATGLVAALDDDGHLAFYDADDPEQPEPFTVDSPAAGNERDRGATSDQNGGDRPAPRGESAESQTTNRPDADTNSGPRTKRDAPPQPSPQDVAQTRRSAAAAAIATTTPPRSKLLDVFADTIALDVISGTNHDAIRALTHSWGGDPGDLSTPDARLDHAWTTTLAALEVDTRSRTQWTTAQRTYLSLLRDRGKYQPTPWERQQLDRADS